MRKIDNLSILFAISIGALHSWLVMTFWSAYDGSPINELLLINTLAKIESYEWSLAILYAHDMVINLLIALPFALIFFLFRRLNDWRLLFIALFSGILLFYWNIEPSSFIPILELEKWWVWFGIGLAYISLPIAFSSVRYYYKKRLHIA